MKRLLSTAILCMLIGMTFAQKSKVKEARKAMDSNKFSEAKQLLQPALTDAETATDQETWKTVGDIEYKIFDNERDKELKGQLTGEKPNEELMYTSLYATFAPFMKADSLGELPDEKGKIKNKVRKDIIAKLVSSHAHYYNGGAYYSGKGDQSKAADFFARYAWGIPEARVFADTKDQINTNDTTFQIIKYYAAISAIQAKEHDKAIDFLNKMKKDQYMPNKAFKESDIYELLAEEYKKKEDSVSFTVALEEGADRFPENSYFISNIINQFINKKDFDKAVIYLDQAIANKPANACDLYSVKANIFADKNEFDEAFDVYNKALSEDPNCERALEGIGVAYTLKAKEVITQNPNAEAEVIELYKKSIPYFEKYRSLLEARNADKEVLKSALYKLRNVYYVLTMDEFTEIDKQYEELSK